MKVKQRFTLPVAVLLMARRKDEVLLIRRHNTGWQDGKYSLVAGHIDGNESLIKAVCREAYEEVGIVVDPADVSLAHTAHLNSNKEYLHFFFETKKWKGEPENKEPQKCDDVSWFSLSKLPPEVASDVLPVLQLYKQGIRYSETGW